MRNAHFHSQPFQPRRRRRTNSGPRAEAQFTVDLTAGPAPWPRSRRGEFGPPRGRDFGPDGPGGGGFGPGGPGPGGFGPGGPRGVGPGGPGGRGRGPGGRGRGGRGRRAGRGDVRAAILLLLAEEPMHGYQIIQEITERSSGAWTPSPGAVYPAIGLLTDEGLVSTAREGGRNLASLTDAGRAYVADNAAELGNPWEAASGHGPHRRHELRAGVEAIIDATRQVGRVGTDAQVTAALTVLDKARREIYLILAQADDAQVTPADNGESSTSADDGPPADEASPSADSAG